MFGCNYDIEQDACSGCSSAQIMLLACSLHAVTRCDKHGRPGKANHTLVQAFHIPASSHWAERKQAGTTEVMPGRRESLAMFTCHMLSSMVPHYRAAVRPVTLTTPTDVAAATLNSATSAGGPVVWSSELCPGPRALKWCERRLQCWLRLGSGEAKAPVASAICELGVCLTPGVLGLCDTSAILIAGVCNTALSLSRTLIVDLPMRLQGAKQS